MARFWARWYEPKSDPWPKLEAAIAAGLREGMPQAMEFQRALAMLAVSKAIRDEGFEIEWPFWDIPDRAHMTKKWISGEAASGEYCIVCAVFDAPNEATVRAEIGELEGVSVEPQEDDWRPGDRFAWEDG